LASANVRFLLVEERLTALLRVFSLLEDVVDLDEDCDCLSLSQDSVVPDPAFVEAEDVNLGGSRLLHLARAPGSMVLGWQAVLARVWELQSEEAETDSGNG